MLTMTTCCGPGLGALGPATGRPDWGTGPDYNAWPDDDKQRAFYWRGDITRHHLATWPLLQAASRAADKRTYVVGALALVGVILGGIALARS